MQLACNQLQYWLRYPRCAVCDFRRADFTNKLTRRSLITKLFCERGKERVNTNLFRFCDVLYCLLFLVPVLPALQLAVSVLFCLLIIVSGVIFSGWFELFCPTLLVIVSDVIVSGQFDLFCPTHSCGVGDGIRSVPFQVTNFLAITTVFVFCFVGSSLASL